MVEYGSTTYEFLLIILGKERSYVRNLATLRVYICNFVSYLIEEISSDESTSKTRSTNEKAKHLSVSSLTEAINIRK